MSIAHTQQLLVSENDNLNKPSRGHLLEFDVILIKHNISYQLLYIVGFNLTQTTVSGSIIEVRDCSSFIQCMFDTLLACADSSCIKNWPTLVGFSLEFHRFRMDLEETMAKKRIINNMQVVASS